MSNPPQHNRVRLRGEVFAAEHVAATEEDHCFGIKAIWNLIDSDGNEVRRGLVKWLDADGGGWGFWRGKGNRSERLETSDVLWLEVDEDMRRWIDRNNLPPSLFDVATQITREELRIETLVVRGHDRLDFHDVSVASLRRALERAYLEGMER